MYVCVDWLELLSQKLQPANTSPVFTQHNIHTRKPVSYKERTHVPINVPYSQSEVILQEFKKLSLSLQTIAQMNQHTHQNML